MDEGLAVIVAAAMAILGIFYTSRQQRKLLRKQHTYRVLEKMNDWEKLDSYLDFASGLIKSGKIPQLYNDDNKDACDKIDFILNHYEFLSAAMISGDIDEDLVRGVEETRLTRVFLKFIDYIEENREDRNTLLLWENLEFMCHRWSVAKRDSYDRFLDRLLLRPALGAFLCNRDRVWEDLKRQSEEIR